MFVNVSRADLALDLWAYGEDDLAVRAHELSDLEVSRIGVIAGRLMLDEAHSTPSGASMLLSKACALAAVEVMEGEHRVLKRHRRRSVPEPSHRESRPLPGAQPPREVFLAACANVSARFESRRFRYAKSGPHMSRAGGEFRHTVSFASSHHNVAGRHVELTLYAEVRSKALRHWRVEHRPSGEDANDHVAGGMLQNLGVEMPVAIWDLADPESRPEVLDAITKAIEEVALPYFSLFSDSDALVRRLRVVPIPSFYALSTIEWLLSRNESQAALEHAGVLLHDRDLYRRYERIREKMESGKMALLPYFGDAEGLAYAALAYGLEY